MQLDRASRHSAGATRAHHSVHVQRNRHGEADQNRQSTRFFLPAPFSSSELFRPSGCSGCVGRARNVSCSEGTTKARIARAKAAEFARFRLTERPPRAAPACAALAVPPRPASSTFRPAFARGPGQRVRCGASPTRALCAARKRKVRKPAASQEPEWRRVDQGDRRARAGAPHCERVVVARTVAGSGREGSPPAWCKP